jgi:hypothetical protein
MKDPRPMTDDDSHRIHIASGDPAFPAKRDAAVMLICAAIDAIVSPLGYTCKGTTWSRSSAQGRTIVNLQRSQYGWHADINLRFILPNGELAQDGHWAEHDDAHIGQFYRPGEGSGSEPGRLAYLDISEASSILDEAMYILQSRAIPWLDGHHDQTSG